MMSSQIPFPENLLTKNEYEALKKIQTVVNNMFEIETVVLFGSVVRGEADEKSDIDLLLITRNRLNREERHQITDVVCEINLEYDTNFSTLVVDSLTWDSGSIALSTIREEIRHEGIPIS